MDETDNKVQLAIHETRLATIETDIKEINYKLDTIMNDMSLYKHIIGVAKTLFYIFLAVLTFKFGDIGTLLGKIFHG